MDAKERLQAGEELKSSPYEHYETISQAKEGNQDRLVHLFQDRKVGRTVTRFWGGGGGGGGVWGTRNRSRAPEKHPRELKHPAALATYLHQTKDEHELRNWIKNAKKRTFEKIQRGKRSSSRGGRPRKT